MQELFRVPIGYIRLTKIGANKFATELLTYTDADLEDEDNAVEAIMSAKAQRLNLFIEARGQDHWGQPFEWLLKSGETNIIAVERDFRKVTKVLLNLSPMDWIAVDEIGEKP